MRDKETDKTNSRRDFISRLGFLGGASEEKIKVLTKDGELVWVNASALNGEAENARLSNRDLLEWINAKFNKNHHESNGK